MNKKLLIPLAVFVVLVGFLFVGLWRDPREVPSPLIGKPAPQFTLRAAARSPARRSARADMKGQVWLLNVWASWCVSCREEHPLLVELGKAKLVPIVGLNYKDEPAAGMQLARAERRPVHALGGRPRRRASASTSASTACRRPSSSTRQGMIRYKQIGPITAEALEKKILPLVRELQKS